MTDMNLWCIGSAICIATSMAGIVGIIGSLCAVAGAIISIVGNLINTGVIKICNAHLTAVRLWTASSFLMALWAAGHEIGWWNGGLAVLAILGMNLVFLLSNLWGLQKHAQDYSSIDVLKKSQTRDEKK